VGSGCRNPVAFKKAIFASSKLFTFGKKIGHDMRILDIGGGFPGHDTENISFDQIAKIIQKALNDYFYFPDSHSEFGLKGSKNSDLEIIAEPGR
jgi:ornithine decarboxylase